MFNNHDQIFRDFSFLELKKFYCELEDVDWNDPLPWLPLPNFKHSEMARLMGCTDEEFIKELEMDENNEI